MSPTDKIVVFDAAEIEALAIEPQHVRAAVQQILIEAAEGRAAGGLKTQVNAPTGAYFQALPSLSSDMGLAAVKWAALVPPRPGAPSVLATILLSDIDTGATIAALDGAWITRARTGALSAIAAHALAPPNPASLGLIGAGAQARAHLLALQEVFPSIKDVTAYDRSVSAAEDLVRWAGMRGLQGRAVEEPAAAVRHHDIVVSTVPAAGLEGPLLDAEWLADDCFVSMVDLGRSWRPESLHHLHLVATDDRAQSKALTQAGKLAYRGEYDFTLAEFVMGRRPGDRPGRNALIFGGIGLADLAVAALVWRMARGADGAAAGEPILRERTAADATPAPFGGGS